MHAEDAYLFRHALLRDAAYEMQLPSARARLHRLCARAIRREVLWRAVASANTDSLSSAYRQMSGEIATHYRLANNYSSSPLTLERELRFTILAAQHADSEYQYRQSNELWLRAADIGSATQRCEYLGNSATNLASLGDPAKAESMYRRAIEMANTSGNVEAHLRLLYTLGVLLNQTARAAEAEDTYATVIALAERQGHMRMLAVTKASLFLLYVETGRYDEANYQYRQTSALVFEHADLATKASLLGNYSNFLLTIGRFNEARTGFLAALEIAKRLDDSQLEAQFNSNMGVLLCDVGELEEGAKALRAALNAHRQTGDLMFQGLTEGNLAAIEHQLGLSDSATTRFENSISLLEEIGASAYLAGILGNYSVLLRDAGDAIRGLEVCTRGIALAKNAHAKVRECILRVQSALCLIELERIEEAKREWTAGVAGLLELGTTSKVTKYANQMKEVCAKAAIEPFDVPGEQQASAASDE